MLILVRRAWQKITALVRAFARYLRYGSLPATQALDFSEIRRRESEHVMKSREARIPKAIRDYDVGLAMSGGGLRSATFGLGVLQGLAESNVLPEVDYISAVSGGGYVTAWLAKLISTHGFKEASARLTSESLEVHWLRGAMSYLRSRAGRHITRSTLFLATYLHNLCSSLLSLVCIITALVLAPRVVLSTAQAILAHPALVRIAAFSGPALLLTALLMVVLFLILRRLRNPKPYESNLFKPYALLGAAVAVIGFFCRMVQANLKLSTNLMGEYAVAVVLALTIHCIWQTRYHRIVGAKARSRRRMTLILIAYAGLFLSSIWIFDLSRTFAEPKHFRVIDDVRTLWSASHEALLSALAVVLLRFRIGQPDFVVSVLLFGAGLATIAAARGLMKQFTLNRIYRFMTRRVLGSINYLMSCALLFVLSWYIARRLPAIVWHLKQTQAALGPQALPMFFGAVVPIGIILAGVTLAVGVALLGRTLSPYVREGITDVIASLYKTTSQWIFAFIIAVYGPVVLYRTDIHQDVYFWVIWIGTIVSGLLMRTHTHEGAGRRSAMVQALLYGLPYIFLSGVLILVSFGISRWVFHIDHFNGFAAYFEAFSKTLTPESVWLCAIVVLIGAVLSARSGVNSSSMHQYYLNRLSETFLGEPPSGATKHFDSLRSSGFSAEQLCLHHLRASNGYQGPLVIFNCCLNAIDRKDPRARLGENFIFSPFGCGFFPGTERASNGVFQDASEYSYSGEEGVRVASSIAISGSALGAAMGDFSSAKTRLFHTLFNLRLGCWFCNPNHNGAWNGNIPRSQISCHMKELVGNMTDREPFVYLSDGGHFENIGMYELLRRRCRIVIVSDASEDSGHTYASLARAVSRARVDLGVEVEFTEDGRGGSSSVPSGGVSTGIITYPGGQEGRIIYIKPELTGNEPMDVVGYGRQHPAFPQQSTMHQYFTEMQFEAYRKLGEILGREAGERYWGRHDRNSANGPSHLVDKEDINS